MLLFNSYLRMRSQHMNYKSRRLITALTLIALVALIFLGN
jgi:hypothetical protein